MVGHKFLEFRQKARTSEWHKPKKGTTIRSEKSVKSSVKPGGYDTIKIKFKDNKNFENSI